MALGIGYGLPFVGQHGTNPYKTQWAAALEGAKGAGASVEDENAGTGSCLVSRGQDVYTDGLPSTPSLLIVPQFYKAGNLYQDVPPFVAEDLTMRFTVSRNTTATRVNSSGLIESVASGVPRIDWLGQSCPALLVEPSATNLCRYSEQFNTVTSGWSAAALQPITGNTNATLDPAGGNTADLIVATTGTTNHDIRPSVDNLPAFVSGTTYTYSIFAKATSATSGFIQMYFGAIDFSPALPFANFQLSGNGAVTTGTYSAATIQSFGNGWYRCSLTATAAASGNAAAPIQAILTSGVTRNGTFAGNGVDGVYLWGAQLEVGSVATTYIPTTTAAVSRAADVISASGALVSGLIGQTEGTMYVEVDLRNISGLKAIIQLDNGTGDNRLLIQLSSPNTLNFFAANGGSVSTIASGTITTGTHKIAASYSSANVQIYMDGLFLASGTMANYPSLALSNVSIGSRIFSGVQGNFLNDRIRAAALYTTRLSNDQLANLTALT